MQSPDMPPQPNSSDPTAMSPDEAVPESTQSNQSTQNNQDEHKGNGFIAKVKTLISALLLIAISGGIGYGIGSLQSKLQIKQAREDNAIALDQAETQLSEANAKVAAAEARSEYAQVQLRLLESIDELEQRNFGNANTQLRLASETLSNIEISQNPDQLAELQEELSTAEINFAVNPVEQRQLMLSYSEQIEALLPK